MERGQIRLTYACVRPSTELLYWSLGRTSVGPGKNSNGMNAETGRLRGWRPNFGHGPRTEVHAQPVHYDGQYKHIHGDLHACLLDLQAHDRRESWVVCITEVRAGRGMAWHGPRGDIPPRCLTVRPP